MQSAGAAAQQRKVQNRNIQLLAGMFRLGFLLRFVSHSVMTGFLNGVSVLIILGQLGDLTGFSSRFGSTFVTVLQRYAAELRAHDSKLMLGGVDEGMRSQLAKTGVLALIGAENVFLATAQIGEALNQAITAAHEWLAQGQPA